MSTRSEKYWTESGRGDGQGDVEKKDHQSYRRPYMMGKARGKGKDLARQYQESPYMNLDMDVIHHASETVVPPTNGGDATANDVSTVYL